MTERLLFQFCLNQIIRICIILLEIFTYLQRRTLKLALDEPFWVTVAIGRLQLWHYKRGSHRCKSIAIIIEWFYPSLVVFSNGQLCVFSEKWMTKVIILQIFSSQKLFTFLLKGVNFTTTFIILFVLVKKI